MGSTIEAREFGGGGRRSDDSSAFLAAQYLSVCTLLALYLAKQLPVPVNLSMVFHRSVCHLWPSRTSPAKKKRVVLGGGSSLGLSPKVSMAL
jgi:hypothetical protein